MRVVPSQPSSADCHRAKWLALDLGRPRQTKMGLAVRGGQYGRETAASERYLWAIEAGRRSQRSSIARIRAGGESRGRWLRVARRRAGPRGRSRSHLAWWDRELFPSDRRRPPEIW